MKPSSVAAEQSVSLTPNRLFDTVIEQMNLKNDAALARVLGVSSSVISKIRRYKRPVGASLLIRLHEETELSIAALRKLLGETPRTSTSISTTCNQACA